LLHVFFFHKNSVFLVQPHILMVEPFFSLKYPYSIFIFLQYLYLRNSKVPKTEAFLVCRCVKNTVNTKNTVLKI